MVLLVGSDSGSVNKPENNRLSSSSSATLNGDIPTTATPLPRRVSKRIVLVHVFHASILALTGALLVSGAFRMEHGIEVNAGQAIHLASYLTLGLQAFFTGVVLLLYEATRTVAVDSAIRHPHNLKQLNDTLSAWSGLPAAVLNWFSKPSSTNKLYPRHRSVYLGIPLYLLCGAILQLSASAILGVNLYQVAYKAENIGYSAASHVGNYGTESSDKDDANWLVDRRLWRAAREEMFLPKINDTSWPGLHGNIVHDIPIATMLGFESARINGTRVNVECAQPERATVGVEVLLLPPGSDDVTSLAETSIIHFDGSSPIYNIRQAYHPVWFNVSLPAPPYWDPSVPGLFITSPWAKDKFNDSLPTKVALQPWFFSGEGAIGHDQVVFVLATSDPELLIHDTDGSPGWAEEFTFIPHPPWDEDDEDDESDGVSAYLQVIGCTMHSSEIQVTVSQKGSLISTNDPPEKTAERFSSPFEWDGVCDSTVDRQFLITWTPTPGSAPVESLLQKALLDMESDGPVTIDAVEDKLERLTASYLYNYWRRCQGPMLAFASECEDFHVTAEAEESQAVFWTVGTAARLEINLWRAGIAFCASLVMAALAVGLLGVKTDLKEGQERKQWTVVESVGLMRESALPVIMAAYGPDELRIRYRPASGDVFANLDYYEESQKTA